MACIYEVYYRDKTICFYLRSSIVACFNFNNIVGIKEIGEVK